MTPDSITKITTELDVRAFAPGEKLRGRAEWSNGASAELRLFYFTGGKGTQDVEVIETRTLDVPSAFEFQLPPGPYSFSGKLVSLSWALELIIQPGGHVERLDFILSPNGGEIDLTRYEIPVDLLKITKRMFHFSSKR